MFRTIIFHLRSDHVELDRVRGKYFIKMFAFTIQITPSYLNKQILSIWKYSLSNACAPFLSTFSTRNLNSRGLQGRSFKSPRPELCHSDHIPKGLRSILRSLRDRSLDRAGDCLLVRDWDDIVADNGSR